MSDAFRRRRTAYLGLGSNVGDRLANLSSALERLRAADEVEVLRLSSVYETEPVGEIADQDDFYNAAVEIETTLHPRALLDLCKRIERDLGRVAQEQRHGPRPIDVDLLIVADLLLADEGLVVPHPELTNRRFVMVPLLEIDPDLSLPDGTSLAGALAALEPGQRVERIEALV